MLNTGRGVCCKIIDLTAALGTPERSTCGVILTEEAHFSNWIFLIHGTKHLIDVLGEDLKHTILAPLLSYGASRWKLQHCETHNARLGGNEILDNLQTLISRDVQDDDLLHIYIIAINNLRGAYCIADWDIVDAFIWIYGCADGFSTLLGAPTQEALVILAHFCVLLKRSERQWWLQGWSDHTMSTIYHLLDEKHKLWVLSPAEEVGWVAPFT
jgi:hypothetical protein